MLESVIGEECAENQEIENNQLGENESNLEANTMLNYRK